MRLFDDFSPLEKWSIIIFLLAVAEAVCLYFWLLTAGIVANESGEISGSINKLREKVQGKRFWRKQLKEIDSELEGCYLYLKQLAETEMTIQESERNLPELRPNQPAREAESLRKRAEALRKRANQIEWDETHRFMRQNMLERIARLKRIRAQVETRAQ